jgi:hypothetical protein
LREPAKTSDTKKTGTKTKAAAKKTAKKPVVKKKKAKKVLTPEEKEKADLRELKKMALLKKPTLLPETAWAVYVTNNIKGGQGKVTDKIKEVARSFAELSESDKEVC